MRSTISVRVPEKGTSHDRHGNGVIADGSLKERFVPSRVFGRRLVIGVGWDY